MHFELIIWAIVGVFILIFVTTGFLEKVYLNDYDLAPGGEPLADTPYFKAMNDGAKRLGFAPAGVYVQSRKSRIYQSRIAFWVSPERDILLQVCGGKTAGVPIRRTILASIISSDQIIQTQDHPAAIDLSGLTDQRMLLNADLDELISFHRERLVSYSEQRRSFSAQIAFSDWSSIRRMRAEQMARMGLAKFLNHEQSIYRYTLKGAWLQYQKGLRGQLAEAQSQAGRASKKRPGSLVK